MEPRREEKSTGTFIAERKKEVEKLEQLKRQFRDAISLYDSAKALKQDNLDAYAARCASVGGYSGIHHFNHEKESGDEQGNAATRIMLSLAAKNYSPAIKWLSKNPDYIENLAAHEEANTAPRSKL